MDQPQITAHFIQSTGNMPFYAYQAILTLPAERTSGQFVAKLQDIEKRSGTSNLQALGAIGGTRQVLLGVQTVDGYRNLLGALEEVYRGATFIPPKQVLIETAQRIAGERDRAR